MNRHDEPGFVLVGVVMFVLALTILGLSLFSLSSFESQFMTRSLSSEQAFNAAQGGIAEARYRLIAKGNLGHVADLAGTGKITSAVAIQEQAGAPESTGAVLLGGNDVLIRIGATVNGETRRLEAWFQPHISINVYKRLMALSDPASGLHVVTFDPPACDTTQPRWETTRLSGNVWMNTASLTNCDSIAQPPSFEAPGGVPDPAIDAFFAVHWATATPVNNTGYSNKFNLNATGTPDNVKFFKTPAPDPDSANWSLAVAFQGGNEPEITVNGTAIWMFDRGATLLRQVTVKGPPNALLVLVAKPTTSPSAPGTGLTFVSGIESQGPGVVLVSNGRVEIETEIQQTTNTIDFLSVYARHARIMGPIQAGPTRLLTLSHPPGHALDTRLDFLWDNGYLPNATGASGAALSFRPGSWRQYPN